jgi:hypothetical protein
MIIKTPKSTKILIFLAKKYLNKIQKNYTKKFHKNLPIILVAGTAGKSSTTLLIKRLFQNDSWDVYSGASQKACLNSLSGLIMVLSGTYANFEGRFLVWKKFIFILKSSILLFLKNYKLNHKTIIVYEVGFNEQNEADYFLQVFGKTVSSLIITNFTAEHTFGFGDNFEEKNYNKLKKFIPIGLQKEFESKDISATLKNIALEQLKLIKTTNKIILPTEIGFINNSFYSNFGDDFKLFNTSIKRGPNFNLIVENKYSFSKEYLVPTTFGKYIHMLLQLQEYYKLSKHSFSETIQEPILPNGRFGVLQGKNNTSIVDSSYNNDPASMEGFLDLLSEVINSFKNWQQFIEENQGENNPANPPKHFLIFGEMRELGITTNSEHSKVLSKILKLTKKYSSFIEDIILIGDSWLECDQDDYNKTDGDITYINFQKQPFKVYKKAGDINKILTEDTIRPNSWFWIKGSQNTIFLEIVVSHLLKNKIDKKKLCRQGLQWEQVREPWI